ncbi:hypothetical protein J2Z40_002614 [Cytobacillus eiseniae]|uniref:Uncharacterized protein n=1 Tax=Cytobacillus eiseniae TaxID=762947 RepID=A0ABS4RGM6_9BACI|nr:hypothetical protein [Cytobacillus eiseniae]
MMVVHLAVAHDYGFVHDLGEYSADHVQVGSLEESLESLPEIFEHQM